ncbi:glycosyltransferase family 2 protein [Sphingomonas faeni]|uniref:glycosyltransferase family 2 protein n=1 Tax=Sphingomonas faeni TaxID=185950 RepID=UPI0020C156D5|nr:glycosyltransferase family 2 protein [Sphingomonas faeni]MCK8456760.1 glycosyltransferase family 2 protein [Sphingomonas faeni]
MTATVIIPTLNEIAHIEALLDTLLREPSSVVGEILVADGGSRDGTRECVADVADRASRVRLIDNPERIQAAGMNRAAAAADPRFAILVRVDAHASYPQDYVARLLTSLATSGADSVVVGLTTRGHSRFQRAVAIAQNSRIGTGGSAHRMGGASGWVDHGHHAAFRRTLFEQAGGYDTSFEANEDAELDARLRALDGRIWLDATIPVIYYPRNTLRGLARQYFRYGSGRARNSHKHGERLRVRQMLPPAITLAIGFSLLGATLLPALLVIPLSYGLALLAASAVFAVKARWLGALMAAPALATMHLAWGAGFLKRKVLQFRTRKPMIDTEIERVRGAERGGEAI